jgi:hypothetical protein
MRWVKKEVVIMTDRHNLNHQIWRAGIITVALGACFVFGIVVLAGGDWLPGLEPSVDALVP